MPQYRTERRRPLRGPGDDASAPGPQRSWLPHTFHTCESMQFDALVVDQSAPAALEQHRKVAVMVQEAYRHHKAIGAIGAGSTVLDEAGVDPGAPGIVTDVGPTPAFADALIDAIGWHRHWERVV